MSIEPDDTRFMRLALEQAQVALHEGEVPVGAVLVRAGELIAAGHNHPIGLSDPCAHAEIIALRTAAAKLGNYRLPDCELYVTLEPCAMCAMAMMHARLKRVVFAARDPKTGAAGSVINLFATTMNHHTAVSEGILSTEASTMLSSFFKSRRMSQQLAKLTKEGE